MKTLGPIKIILSEGGGPYVYKTRLGWCVVGPINCISKGIATSCNRVAVRDVHHQNLLHITAMEKSVKDVSLEEMFPAMYRHYFNEPELVGTSTLLKCGEVSHEDKKFTEIIDRETSKKNDHYVVPLPFHDPNLMLPNNKKRAIQRLMGAQKKIYEGKQILPRLSQLYNLLRSGNAKRVDTSPAGKSWYIPDLGVYHPSKPGKICVVFDCSAEFQGTSIQQGVAIRTRFDKSDYWCLDKIL